MIDWTAMQLRPDPPVTTIAASRITTPGAELPQYLELYTELYFDHFHHRWPILHRASREEQAGEAGLCELSIAMIGAWISGTRKAMKYATEIHAVLIDHITPQLMAVLRETGFFKPETAWHYEKKGIFPPLRWTELGQRQRCIHMFSTKQTNGKLSRRATLPVPMYIVKVGLSGSSRLGGAPACRICSPELEVNVQYSTRRRLDRLHMRLDQIMVQSTVNSDQKEPHLLRHYYGYEDHALPDCHTTVGTRLRCILFDTFMLYHLLSMHLSVDVPKLTQIVKDRRLSTIEESSEAHRFAREKRKTSMIGWALTPAARSALCQFVDVLVAHQTLIKSPKASVDTFCKYQDGAFDTVVVGAGPVAELTAWSMSGDQFTKERKAWIEMGEQSSCSQPRLQGIRLCDTNTDFLVVFFQACLPHGWALADIIAPGIIKIST
ncbi:hypothetical protein SBOR_5309 [Sclerotinia borealis F-4128]|uniref:Uncharacterized protein n=1 Tax=Sclerotinia borealis (strain F-4128) TaxID=1432307 RepID=W9CEN0_SCLBF|nr:hypothetical protein SBOR_5309 [Sclerotinia borealis F-4128]